MQQALVFFREGAFSRADELALEFPLRQTQALIMLLDEIEAWVDLAKTCFGETCLLCMETHYEWLMMVENHVLDVRDALEEGDEGLIACRLTADDLVLEALLTVLDNCPDDDDIRDLMKDSVIAQTLESLTDFWIVHIRQLLSRLLAHASGDGEVLAMLKRQKYLAKLTL